MSYNAGERGTSLPCQLTHKLSLSPPFSSSLPQCRERESKLNDREERNLPTVSKTEYFFLWLPGDNRENSNREDNNREV
jgi:hypothetical protein